MKIAVIGDSHFGKGNDSLAHDNYFGRFYNEVFFPTLRQEGITKVWHLGDLYDRRRFINFDILSRSRKYFVEPISDYEVDFCMGNHDIYHNESNSLNSADLLMNDLDKFHIHQDAIEHKDFPVLFIPWITKENSERTMETIRRTKAKIALGHLDIFGFEMDKGAINKHGLARDIFDKFDAVYSGHFHHKNSDGNISYLGAPYEMTWADCDDPKGFHILDTDSWEMRFVQNPMTLYKKFYYDDVSRIDDIMRIINDGASDFAGKYVKIYIENRTQHNLFDTVHKIITSAGVHDLSTIDKIPEFVIKSSVTNALSESVELGESVGNEDTGKIISTYVSGATYPAHINPDRMRVEMDSLYREASQMTSQT